MADSITKPTNPLAQGVRENVLTLSNILLQLGIEKPAFSDEKALEKFNSLDEQAQLRIFRNYERYVSAASNMMTRDPQALKNNLNLFWYFIKELGFRSSSDLFSHLSPSDIVEIYDSSGIQLYCSLNFFPLTSYSLEEIICFGWDELYKRDTDLTETIYRDVGHVLSGQCKQVYFLSIPEHEVREIFGPQKYVTKIKQKFFAPLFDKNNNVCAFVHAFNLSQT